MGSHWGEGRVLRVWYHLFPSPSLPPSSHPSHLHLPPSFLLLPPSSSYSSSFGVFAGHRVLLHSLSFSLRRARAIGIYCHACLLIELFGFQMAHTIVFVEYACCFEAYIYCKMTSCTVYHFSIMVRIFYINWRHGYTIFFPECIPSYN